MGTLQIINVSKSFQGNIAVDNATMTIKDKRITGLIGPNGAGKTTLFNCTSGYYPASKGRIIYNGKEIQHKAAQDICHAGIARTFQIAKPFGMLSVLDNVAVGGYNRANNDKDAYEYAEKSLELVGLNDKKDSLALLLNTGEQRKLELARALATQPDLLMLDEVMAGLNPVESAEMIQLIRKINENGTTVFMIEHIMPVVMELSDYIYVMDRGQVISEGDPEKVANDPLVIETYLGKGKV